MLELANQNTPDRMSSREVAELIGKNHADVMRDIRNMQSSLTKANLLSCVESATYLGTDNRPYPMYNMDKDTTICLMTGYDVAARMKVIQRWQALEASRAPQSTAEVILMLAQQNVANEKRMIALEQGQAEIKAQLTTRNEEYYTVAGYAALVHKVVNLRVAATLGRKAAKLSKEKGLTVGTTHDPRFGKVGTYHQSVLAEVL
ncbi:Rha family transcriptional regulator [Hymenobacter sp. GOD-10R]|uniref:Rha family transcriptional regulator n=1 Tax=Hymenobacter sp. GOD-10R TaxID=3093922 RepID=UPI002D7881A4|nr:Rha family transcriptional regulator [Hymenobacter sp. GOD-10R]WRQ26710.1 Rha family transcriptional regulator [Hymenobacter sp. GOD-10R]